ncbi:MAG TPA: VOC family protein [Actinomycetota bacterium]|nr:VOC family protein [Actinomycetota bacterium]
MSLSKYDVGVTIAVSDMGRAKEFYEGKLGLSGGEDASDGGRTYRCGGNTSVHVYPSPSNAGQSQATLAGWQVDDLEATVTELAAKGVTFERYDQPPLVTDERGIASFPDGKVAFFKDPDGNTLSLGAPA